MFTGIIEETGTVQEVTDLGTAGPSVAGRRIVIAAATVLEGLSEGDSISVDGVCQTVVGRGDASFSVEAIPATLSRTTLGEFASGRRVNLERSLTADARLDGHLVQGHVDGVGTVTAVEREGNMVRVRFTLPETVRPYAIAHGSIAVDGVSLTINDLPGDGTAEVALIPYTYAHTNLWRLSAESRVNLEADLIGKYVLRAASEYGIHTPDG